MRTAAGSLAKVGCGFFFGGTANPLQPASTTLAAVRAATAARPRQIAQCLPCISPLIWAVSGRLPAVVTAA